MPFQWLCHTIVCERTSSVETFWLIYKITNNNVSTKDSPSYWRDGKAKWKSFLVTIQLRSVSIINIWSIGSQAIVFRFLRRQSTATAPDPDTWHVHIRIYHIILIRFLCAGRWVIRVYDLCCVCEVWRTESVWMRSPDADTMVCVVRWQTQPHT